MVRWESELRTVMSVMTQSRCCTGVDTMIWRIGSFYAESVWRTLKRDLRTPTNTVALGRVRESSAPQTDNRFLIYKCNRDTSMNPENQTTKNDDENPFKNMGFIKFWIVSTVFWFSFPVSLVLCSLTLGSVKTKQLVKALVHDFLQTLFIILVVVCFIVYGIYHYASGLF